MPMLEWNNKLSINVIEVDEQHRKLVDMVNELYDSMISENSHETLLKIVTNMREYTVFHFDTEEKLMTQYDYSEIESHKSEHRDFVKKVEQVEEDCKNGKISLSMDILNFLSEWLVTHINGTDKEMGVFLATKV